MFAFLKGTSWFILHVRQHENYKKWVGDGMIIGYTKNSLGHNNIPCAVAELRNFRSQ